MHALAGLGAGVGREQKDLLRRRRRRPGPCLRWCRTSSAAGPGWPRRSPAGRRAPPACRRFLDAGEDVRRSSPPRLSVSFSSFLASGTSSAATTRATRRSTLAKSSIVMIGSTSGSAASGSAPSTGAVGGRRRLRRRRARIPRLSSIMASTCPCFDPLHHVCETCRPACPPAASATSSQRRDRLAEQLAGLLRPAAAAPAPGRRPAGGTGSSAIVQTSLQLVGSGRVSSRSFQGAALSTYWFARSASAMISRMARL